MLSSHIERIYVDSNIWFAYITNGKYERESEKAAKLIEAIINNPNQKIVVSRLVLVEVINVIRVKIAQKTAFNKLQNEKNKVDIKKISEGLISKFIDIISRSAEILQVNTSIDKILTEVITLKDKIKGDIKEVHKCKICKRHFEGYIYKGVDHWDLHHAILARESKVNSLITFDTGFAELNNYFKSFNITIY